MSQDQHLKVFWLRKPQLFWVWTYLSKESIGLNKKILNIYEWWPTDKGVLRIIFLISQSKTEQPQLDISFGHQDIWF